MDQLDYDLLFKQPITVLGGYIIHFYAIKVLPMNF